MMFSVEIILAVSAILGAGLIAAALLRGSPAALRHWILGVTVLCAWAAPVMSTVLPPWATFSLWSNAAHLPVMDTPTETAPDPGHTVVEAEFATRPNRSGGRFEGVSRATVAYAVWATGSTVSLILLLVGLIRLRWLASNASVISDGPWYACGQALRDSYGLVTAPRILQSSCSSLLITWGWLNPKILIPEDADAWSPECVHAALAHEFAHVARGDWMFQLAGELMRTLYWFNPLSWLACRQLRATSEYACDDAVLAGGISATDYATHLLTIARTLTARPPHLAAAAVSRRSILEGRIRTMLNSRINRRPMSWTLRAGAALSVLVFTIVVAGLSAQAPIVTFVGTALDPTARGIPGTRVMLTNPTTEAKYEVRADGTGRFEFVALPSGTYVLEARVAGFATLREEIQIASALERQFTLQIGTLREEITVGGGPAVPPDPAMQEKRAEARSRFAQLEVQERARCAAGVSGNEGGRILPPKKLLHVGAQFPEHLRAAKIGGDVTLDAVIGVDGLVRDVKNLKAPHPELEAAAAHAVRDWQFSTTLLNCEPVEVEMHVTTKFIVQP